jgi:hypothetical protein
VKEHPNTGPESARHLYVFDCGPSDAGLLRAGQGSRADAWTTRRGGTSAASEPFLAEVRRQLPPPDYRDQQSAGRRPGPAGSATTVEKIKRTACTGVTSASSNGPPTGARTNPRGRHRETHHPDHQRLRTVRTSASRRASAYLNKLLQSPASALPYNVGRRRPNWLIRAQAAHLATDNSGSPNVHL